MPVEIEKLERFHAEVKSCCRVGEYNLFLHKHLGDIFYAVGLRQEFELRTGKKLHFVVRPGHVFLLEMCGIKNYTTYDFGWMEREARVADYPYLPPAAHESHRFDVVVKDVFLSTPVMNEPFILDGEQVHFYLFGNYWCRLWSNNLLGLVHFKYPVPKGKVPMSGEAQEILSRLAPLDKIILIAPDAATAIEIPPEIWDALAEVFHKKGYSVIVNSKKYRIKCATSAFVLGLSLPDVIALGQRCAYVFSLRSGLCDVLVGIGERLYAIYPAQLRREYGSLVKPFEEPTGVNEVQFYHWKTSPLLWEGEDLTLLVQKEIDHLRKLYHREERMIRFCRKAEEAGHRFWSGIFRAVADESHQFPENNVDNPPPREQGRKVKFLGIPLYSRETDAETGAQRKTLLGGLWHERRLGKNKKICLCGLQVYSRNKRRKKVLGITIQRYDYEHRWLVNLARQVGEEYDDVYLLRHNMGETYVELVHIEERARVHGSKKPVVVAWSKRHEDVCRMFLPDWIAVRFIPLEQSDIHWIFREQGEEYRDIMIEAEGHRFFCCTPQIVEHILELRRRDESLNFYRYICESIGVQPAAAKLPEPRISAEDTAHAALMRERLGLADEKYAVLLPEAISLETLDVSFWQNLAAELRRRGYAVYTNRSGAGGDAVSVGVLFELCRHAAGIISMGSGMAVFLTSAGNQMDIIYTPLKLGEKRLDTAMTMRLYSVHHLPGVDAQRVREYNSRVMSTAELTEQILARCPVIKNIS